MKHTSCVYSFLLALALCAVGVAQVQTGTPPFNSFGGGPFDKVNLGNLNVHFDVPIIHKAGRGLSFDYILSYDNAIWTPIGVGGQKTWTPAPNFGWSSNWAGNTGYLTYSTFTEYCYDNMGHQTGVKYTYSGWTYNDPWSNTAHGFNGQIIIYGGSCTGTSVLSFTATATDNSALTLNASGTSGTITTPTGTLLYPPVNPPIAPASTPKTDANGNQITSSTSGVFTDTLGTTALTISGSNPVKFTYTGPNSAAPFYSANYSAYNVKTSFSCSGVSEYTGTGVSLLTSITLPDNSQYQFSYEVNPSFPTYTTGRLQKVTLPTGGSITYGYTGGNSGIMCADGSTAGLTRQLNPGGTWTYTRSGGGNTWTTTVADPTTPTANETVINFSKDSNATLPTNNFYETQRQVYQGSHASGTLLLTTVNCWNNNFNSCATQGVSSPISKLDHYRYLPGVTYPGVSETVYDSNGLLEEDKEIDYVNAPSGSPFLSDTFTTYASLSNSVVGNIIGKVATVTVKDNSGATKAYTSYSYDQTSVTATTGTPQHQSVTGSRANVTQISQQVSGSVTLYQNLTYYDTGTVNTSTDAGLTTSGGPNSTTYSYDNTGSPSHSCGNSFVTSVSEPLSLSRSITWDCNGGAATSFTDENGKLTSIVFSDPNFWRPSSTTDQLNNSTSFAYPNPNAVESTLLFNGNNSVTDRRLQVDGFGRPIVGQRKQGPTVSNYDSVEGDYDLAGRVAKTVPPYSTTAGLTCSGTCPGTTSTYDGLNRVLTAADAGGGTITNSYSMTDVLQTLGPAPSGENTKRKQREYDALGRLKSVCEVTSASGSGACSQAVSQTGFLTTYTYDTLGNLTGVTQNAQATSGQQTRGYLFDMAGRLSSETNPESGTVTFLYDSLSGDTSCGTVSAPGDLVKRTDAMGNVTCYGYDALHRVTSLTYPTGSYSANTPSKKFVYDAATVNGAVMANAKTQLAEAYTCTTCPGTKITDLGFSYSARGELTDVYESTPHSGGYYHTTAAYWANGALSSLSGVPGQGAFTYAPDGEGRLATAAQGSTSLVTSTSFNAASQPLTVVLGLGDSDSYTYDPNTGRTQSYTFTVGATPKSMVGNLTWNPNGTLSKLAITDGFNSGGSQTCKYGDPTASVPGYDDLGRIIKVDCTASVWQQNFTYDVFGNLTKTVPTGGTGIGWNPGYNPANNRYTLAGTSYDTNGNLLTDTFHTYTWDVESHPSTIDSTTCGTNGACLVYDAFGRMVEKNVAGTYSELLYSPIGKTAVMNGNSIIHVYIPLPGGSTFHMVPGGQHFWHRDWLGTIRLDSSRANRAWIFDRAFAPFGEVYKSFGTAGSYDFTGDTQDTVAGTYDTPNRELNPSQGRWISPDPAGLRAVSTGVPQSWNRYAYVANNPLAFIDPDGTSDCDNSEECDGSAGDGSGGDPLGGGDPKVNCPGCGGSTTVNGDGILVNTILGQLAFQTLTANTGPCYYVLANPCGGNQGNSASGNAANNVQSRVRIEQIANHLKNCGGVYPLVAASAGNFKIGSSPGNLAQTSPTDDASNGFNGGNSTTTIDANNFANVDPATQTGVIVHEWFHTMQINNSILFRFRLFFNRQSVEDEANAAAAEALQKCGPG